MVCIHCGHETKVVNSRLQKRSNTVWRRRRCLMCRAVFTTNELVDYSGSWVVAGRGGALKPFNRDKLFLSLYNSCSHRKTALTDASGLTDTIVTKLRPLAEGGSISRSALIQVAQVTLNRFDKLASLNYQAKHK